MKQLLFINLISLWSSLPARHPIKIMAMKKTPWCMCPAPLTIWPPQLRTTIPSCEMSPKWAFTAIIWFRYSALETSCPEVFFLRRVFFAEDHRGFPEAAGWTQWQLWEDGDAAAVRSARRGTGLQRREPRTIYSLEAGHHFLFLFPTLCWG